MPLTAKSDKHLELKGAMIVYDGLTRPEALEAKPGQAPGMKWNVKLVFPPNHPDAYVLDQLCQRELHEGQFKGVMPRGGNHPMGDVGANELNGQFTGYKIINASTFRQPDVRDENGASLSPSQYGPLIFNGQLVDVIIHCQSYDNVSKGIATRLDGVRILTSQNGQRINVGGGGFDVTDVWGGSSQPQNQGQGQGQWGGQPQQAAPQNQGQGQWGGQPQQAAPQNQGQGQWGGQPQQAAPQNQGQQAPQQNASWMPQ